MATHALDFAAEQRDKILAREGLKLVRVFETNEHEPQKDVVLVEDADAHQMVLRIGEHRDPRFFPEGYQGKTFVVPKLVKLAANAPLPYEIEEYVSGDLLFETIPPPSASQLYPYSIAVKLARAFWEFQGAVRTLPFLTPTWTKKEHLEKYFQKMRSILMPRLRRSVEAVIQGEQWQGFWEPNFPSKWKYSADNLILLPDGRLCFIDLAKVGKRFWGYDLGWVFWPRWHHFRDEEYERAVEHAQHLNEFFKLVFEETPEGEERDRSTFFRRCWIVVFERCVGALYDVMNATGHIKANLPTKERQAAYALFVQDLLAITVSRLQSSWGPP